MRPGRFLRTRADLLCVADTWNALGHLVALQEANASVRHLRRADLAGKAWLSLVPTAGIVVMFVGGYGRVARSGSVRKGIGCVLFPIPGAVAIQWFSGGVIEFSLHGVIATRLHPPNGGAGSTRGSRMSETQGRQHLPSARCV